MSPEEDVPAFARAFPDDPRLAELVRAFARGDYARVRREAGAVVDGAGSDDVKRAAREVLRRTKTDPLMVLLLALTAALLAALSAYWLAKSA